MSKELKTALDELLVRAYQMQAYVPRSDELLLDATKKAVENAELALNPNRQRNYDVCVYHLARTMVRSVSAKSPQEAAKLAHDEVLGIVDRMQQTYGACGDRGPEYTEDAEEIQGYSVYPAGVEESSDEDVYLEYNEDGELEACEMKSYDQMRNGSKS